MPACLFYGSADYLVKKFGGSIPGIFHLNLNPMIQHFKNFNPSLGLFIIRIALGFQMILHGWPKMSGGAEKWAKLGNKMALLGIDFAHTFWGFMAAFAEFGGGILLVLGLFYRPSLFMLIITMLVASVYHWTDEGYMSGSHSFELMLVFIGMFIAGPGKYAVSIGR